MSMPSTASPATTARGEGGTGADLRISTLDLGEITSVVINGRGKFMPPWGDILTPEEIEAVVAYAKGLQG